jgi:hypothetical protein
MRANALVVGFFLVLVAAVWPASTSFANVLALIADETGAEPTAWWTSEDARPAGVFDAHLFALAETSEAWIEPARGRTAERIATVLRSPTLTPNNARSLAGLFGASTVVVGRLVPEAQSPVAWLTLDRSALVVEATVYDVATGVTRDTLHLRAVAFGDTPVEARGAAAEMLAALLMQSVHVAGSSTQAADPGALPRADIVVLSDGSAMPYVELRGVVRDAHPAVLEVREAWATGGRLGLRLVLDEGTDVEDVIPRLLRLVGTSSGSLRVVDVQAHGDTVVVRVARTSVGEGRVE